MNTIIEQYVQFAINNGYENNILLGVVNEKNIENGKEYKVISNFTAEITSKPFIEAVAIGLCKRWDGPGELYGEYLEKCIEDITTRQSFAIREYDLEEFIIELGIGK